jgi:hypothetical protein
MDLSGGFVIGVVASLVASAIWHVVSYKLPTLIYDSGSLDGIWVWCFPSSNTTEGDTIEFYRIKHFRNDRIKIHIDNYNSSRSGNPWSVIGEGVYRGIFLSAIYYFKDQNIHIAGTMNLRLHEDKKADRILSGVVTQYYDREGSMRVRPQSTIMVLRKVKVPIHMQIRALFTKTYFSKFTDAQRFINDNCDCK